MAEDETRFAHKEMLFAGLVWLKSNITWLTVNSEVPDTVGSARDSALTGGPISSDDLIDPAFVDPDAAEEHPLEKGDVIMYVSGRVMQGQRSGTASCACLLSDAEILYIAPVVGMTVVQGQPVFLGAWCISNPQPTEDCTVPDEE